MTLRREQIAAEVCFSTDKFRARANLAEQLRVAEIGHEILTVRRDAEGNPADRLHEECSVRGAIREVDVDMFDIFALAAIVDDRGASDVFPTVIAEAMTSGKAVVSTTVAGIPELVADGATGLLVAPRDAVALADAIERLIINQPLREKFGHAGRERIETNFTIEQTIEPLVQRFAAAAARRNVVC